MTEAMVTTAVREPEVQFTVTDLRQYGYCRRIPFYTMLSVARRPVTFKMEHGIAARPRRLVGPGLAAR